MTNKAFGNFEVSNLAIKPHDKVKARINIDGFILESDWVMADGLIFSQIHDAEISGGIFNATISSQNSWMFVSALRSDEDPKGDIRLLKGIDMKHSSEYKKLPNQPSKIIKLAEFKEAKHPLVYFNTTVPLEKYFTISTEFSTPETKGLSIAKTGSWSVNNIYNNPKDMVSLTRKYGHPFEYINYVYDGVSIITKYYQEQCNSCNAVDYEKLFDKQENTINNQQLNQGMNKVRL